MGLILAIKDWATKNTAMLCRADSVFFQDIGNPSLKT